ncbi:MAG TPA: methylglyoxal synthase [Clostridiales bacterium]|jgi:methylglyoxal synthase|nr:methylglyoxal synthase [Clostridiales bacterium]
MTIALIAHDTKKELMCQFCSAYQDVLKAHKLYATSATARQIQNRTDLKIKELMLGSMGGIEQITSMACYGEIDVVIMFRDVDKMEDDHNETALLKTCDRFAIPYATNMITGEIIVRSIAQGDLDWLEYEHKKNVNLG